MCYSIKTQFFSKNNFFRAHTVSSLWLDLWNTAVRNLPGRNSKGAPHTSSSRPMSATVKLINAPVGRHAVPIQHRVLVHGAREQVVARRVTSESL